ncbi:unnamed protein product [Closterium sp. NIES-53]
MRLHSVQPPLPYPRLPSMQPPLPFPVRHPSVAVGRFLPQLQLPLGGGGCEGVGSQGSGTRDVEECAEGVWEHGGGSRRQPP